MELLALRSAAAGREEEIVASPDDNDRMAFQHVIVAPLIPHEQSKINLGRLR
jgi:hypothetical protein